MSTDSWWSCSTDFRAASDEWDETYIVGPFLYWHRYEVVRTTPKGVWLKGMFETFFVLGTALRQRAVPTKELALRDEIARRQREIQGHAARMRRAEQRLELAMKTLASDGGSNGRPDLLQSLHLPS